MAWEQDYYDVYEAARVLEISPARVRKMLRAGELQGKRGERLVEGSPGPWRLPAGAVHAARLVVGVSDAEDTVVMPSEETAAPEGATTAAGDAPSETSERLSEGVQDLREKAGALRRAGCPRGAIGGRGDGAARPEGGAAAGGAGLRGAAGGAGSGEGAARRDRRAARATRTGLAEVAGRPMRGSWTALP